MPTAKVLRDGVHSNWFWVRGRIVGINPTPTEDTQEKSSGACTVSGSIVTVSHGFAKNSLINYLCQVGSSYYIISANTTTAFTVNGTPDSTAVTYTIYKKGIQIWYCRIPDYLTGDSDVIPGLDQDADIICLRASRDLLSMLPKTEERMKSIINLNAMIEKKYQILFKNKNAKYGGAPIVITPFPMRSDSFSIGDISGSTTDADE